MRPIGRGYSRRHREAARTLRMDRPSEPGQGAPSVVQPAMPERIRVTLAMVQIYADGSVSVLSGIREIGQGSHTILTQIAAEEWACRSKK